MKIDGRGRHGNCGRKKKADTRTNNVNIRLNDEERERFLSACEKSGKSQADFVMYMIDNYEEVIS